MFWLGLLVGGMIGGCGGVMVVALCRANIRDQR